MFKRFTFAAMNKVLLIALIWAHFSSSAEDDCSVHYNDCGQCHRIFDDDLSTVMTLKSRDGNKKTSFRNRRLEINQACVNTTHIDFRAVLDSGVKCSELRILSVKNINDSCKMKNICRATDLIKTSNATSCLIKCPKREMDDVKYEVNLTFGLFDTTWQLYDLRIYNGNDCFPNPCGNSGSCTDGHHSFSCEYPTGYTARSYYQDGCSSNPCGNHGNCTLNNGNEASYECVCEDGFNRPNCENNIDDCIDDNTCSNNGTCIDGVNSYNCSCRPGFSGRNCETNIDDCNSFPCQHGGTCHDEINAYECQCVVEFEGLQCETNRYVDIDECQSNPCQNGGTCNDKTNSFECHCLHDVRGTTCEEDTFYEFVSDCRQNWTPPANWSDGNLPVIYRSFDILNCINMNGAQQVEGIFGLAIETNKDLRQWVDLGKLSGACLMDSKTCTKGAAVTAWIKINRCFASQGEWDGVIIGALQNGASVGFEIRCDFYSWYYGRRFLHLGYEVLVHDGYFYLTHQTPLRQWFHLALILCRPEDGDGIILYHNGDQVASDRLKKNGQFSEGGGEMSIGRRYLDVDSNYASVQVDELMLWNHQLSPSRISLLTEKNDCPQTNPCQNGGTCVDGVGSYHCDCQYTYTGEHCENVNNCPDENPCENDGICIDAENTYTCSCLPDVRGENCAEDCRNSWDVPLYWPSGNLPVVYRSFENLTCIAMLDESQKVNGKLGRGVTTGQSVIRPIYLGDMSGACFVKPQTCCCSGATLTAWIKVNQTCGNNQGILSSRQQEGYQGFVLECSTGGNVRFQIYASNYEFWIDVSTERNKWIHISIVYHGSNEGFTVFYFGNKKERSRRNEWGSLYQSDGHVVIGKKHTHSNNYYGSVSVDELMFWDAQLSEVELRILAFEKNECESNPCNNGGSCVDEMSSFSCECTADFRGDSCEIDCHEHWNASSNWSTGDQPAVYRGFENITCAELMFLAVQVKGKISQGISTGNYGAWVSLGDLSDVACITNTNKCSGMGATVSFWVRLHPATYSGTILSSYGTSYSPGFCVWYHQTTIVYWITVVSSYFEIRVIENSNVWVHVALVYSGPNYGQGIRVYHNSLHKGNDNTRTTRTTGPPSGVLKIGRRFNEPYGAYHGQVTVDELTLWNRQLSEMEIQSIMAVK